MGLSSTAEINVEEEIKLNADIVLVSVDALVCKYCGERYYDRRVMKYLEQIEEKIKSKQVCFRTTGSVLCIDKDVKEIGVYHQPVMG